MDKKHKKTLLIIIGAVILITVVIVTFAYFVAAVQKNGDQNAEITAGTLKLTFADNDDNSNNLAGNLNFGENVIKKFTITNEGTIDDYADISWYLMQNEYLPGSLVYTLKQTTDEGVETTLVNEKNVPIGTREKVTLAEKILIPADTVTTGSGHPSRTYSYELQIKFVNTNFDQTSDINATFNSKFALDEGNSGYDLGANEAVYTNNNSTNCTGTSNAQCAIDELYGIFSNKLTN